jgi:hypothetical protein
MQRSVLQACNNHTLDDLLLRTPIPTSAVQWPVLMALVAQWQDAHGDMVDKLLSQVWDE